jgi:hypothetical protein
MASFVAGVELSNAVVTVTLLVELVVVPAVTTTVPAALGSGP